GVDENVPLRICGDTDALAHEHVRRQLHEIGHYLVRNIRRRIQRLRPEGRGAATTTAAARCLRAAGTAAATATATSLRATGASAAGGGGPGGGCRAAAGGGCLTWGKRGG